MGSFKFHKRALHWAKRICNDFAQIKVHLVRGVPRSKIIIIGVHNLDLLVELCEGKSAGTIKFYREIFLYPTLPLDLFRVLISAVRKPYIFKGNFLLDLYYATLLRKINPEKVLTLCDNYLSMHNVARLVHPVDVWFFQDANRYDFLEEWDCKGRSRMFMPTYVCFGHAVADLLRRSNAEVGRFLPIGSLRNALYMRSKEKRKTSEYKYHICVVCEPSPGWNNHHPGFEEAIGLIASHAARFSNENNLRVIFSGKRAVSKGNDAQKQIFDAECDWYKKFLQDKYELTPRHNIFSTYENIDVSEITIGFCSSALSEALARRKKVLFCNFTGRSIWDQPVEGVWMLTNSSYEAFEIAVSTILALEEDEYYRQSRELREQTMNMGEQTKLLSVID